MVQPWSRGLSTKVSKPVRRPFVKELWVVLRNILCIFIKYNQYNHIFNSKLYHYNMWKVSWGWEGKYL